jgi:two-component system, OmpR family, response regulator
VSSFGWVAERREPPAQWDLRRCGWTLTRATPDAADICLVDMAGQRAAQPPPVPDPTRCLYIGVRCPRERTTLLAAGAGEVVRPDVDLAELDQRARRVLASREWLPRRRDVGPLTLDLLHRDARAGERWLSLHPREFELLWRLAERPGECVSRARLLREVWRLDFEPGTNTVEVHVSRLRTKLAARGIDGLVQTVPESGYRIGPALGAPGRGAPSTSTFVPP